MPILIKRYANRKLYNTASSRYITLKGIAELLDRGETVQVIDNETGEDITSVALSQVLVDSERSHGDVSQTLLSQIFERGGDALYGALRRGVGDATESLEEFQERVRRMVPFGDAASDPSGEAPSSKGAQSSRPGGGGRKDAGGKSHGRPGRRMSDWIAYSSPDFDHILQSSMEHVFKLLDLPRRSDIETLNQNLERVAAAVEKLEGRTSAGPSTGPDEQGAEQDVAAGDETGR